jgi:hypothetical protein
MPLLSEFPDQVIASHALVAAEVMCGEHPSTDTMLELAAEALTVDRLTVMAGRQTRTIAETRSLWNATFACFKNCLDLWLRAPLDDDQDHLLATHRRLLERLVASARERVQFYTVSDRERAIYNAGRDNGLPLTSQYADT